MLLIRGMERVIISTEQFLELQAQYLETQTGMEEIAWIGAQFPGKILLVSDHPELFENGEITT